MKVSCVSLLTAGRLVTNDRKKVRHGNGISSLHPFVALVRCIRYGKFARFTDYLVCLF